MHTVTKRLIDIDDYLLETARTISGETTYRATIEAVLKAYTDDALLMEHIEFICHPDNAVDPALLAEARDPGLPVVEEDDE